jgi:hypothetical protein
MLVTTAATTRLKTDVNTIIKVSYMLHKPKWTLFSLAATKRVPYLHGRIWPVLIHFPRAHKL